MIHKLMDIFGWKDSNKANSKPSAPPDRIEEKTAVSDSNPQDSNQTLVVTKLSNSTDTSQNTSSSENGIDLLSYLKSTAKSARNRDGCLGCKITASVMLSSSVMFAQVVIMKKRREVIAAQTGRLKRHTAKQLFVIQVCLLGTWVLFMCNEWMVPGDQKTTEDKV